MEGTPFGRYRLIEMFGRGGMGEVWRAHDTVTDRTVAIKLLPANFSDDENFQRRFRREAQAAARLNTPHVVPIHDYGEIDGRLYVNMRLVEGKDLATVLADGPIEPDRAVRIIEGVAKALHAAHEAGLLHRDVKPSNILLDRDDFPYLIDFGIARALGETRMTKTGKTIGTFQYIAPERLGTRGEDARADIYSLTCVLYECLTGGPPFGQVTMAELVVAHLNRTPPPPSSALPKLPEQLDRVIAHGMAKDPEQRYATTLELAAAAREAITAPIASSQPTRMPDIASMPTTALPISPTVPAPRRPLPDDIHAPRSGPQRRAVDPPTRRTPAEAPKSWPPVELSKPRPLVDVPKPRPPVDVPKPRPPVDAPKPRPPVEVSRPRAFVDVPKPPDSSAASTKPTSPPLWRRKAVAIPAASVVVVVAAVIGLTSVGKTPSHVSGHSDVSALLAQSAQNTRALKSAHLVQAVTGKIQGLSVKTLTADLTTIPGAAASGRETYTFLGSEITADLVIVGGESFTKLDKTWYKHGKASDSYDPTTVLNPDTGLANILSNFSGATSGGSETINGSPTTKVKGQVSADAVRNILPKTSVGGPVPAIAWIGENGNHPLVQLSLEPTSGNTLQMTLSNWNSPVSVTRPPGV